MVSGPNTGCYETKKLVMACLDQSRLVMFIVVTGRDHISNPD
jgi:hypothetical protein